ncbi:hypothetical protein MHZ36_08340 [Staphylococcus sp. ACRSN]|uniref:hypothetical protein n=1 Tax=Staphylococcus sp. ACRSN TaxID=2918214 RepID=UPI001EF206C7|nr:hypothetical protein [Staphylococcus sp. ACRSN]MCG7339298.1 hypothetical protein [Staphylococcus sp. ACRSN]
MSITLNNFYYHEITKILNSEHILKQPIPLPNSLNQYFNAVIEDTNDNNAPNIQNNLRQLIQLIFQIDVHTKSTDCITSNISIIEAIVKHINQCSTDNHNCLWFAKRYYLNYSYLSREFSSFMSCPLSEYILGCKIHASACELYRGLSSEQIWEKYNFKSHQDYLLHFKRIHSCFPQEFKQYTSNR